MPPRSLGQELSKQLRYIRSSAKLYDEGQHDEAVRIATVIRVLLHDTPKSTSLLAHLGIKDKITIVSSCPDFDAETPNMPRDVVFETAAAFGLGLLASGPDGPHYLPSVAFEVPPSMPPRQLSVLDWWNQVVWVLDSSTRVTRRDLVLGAANKDGGAHVALERSPAYERLVNGQFEMWTSGDGTVHKQLRDLHLVSLREMGNELLTSAQLTALAAPGEA